MVAVTWSKEAKMIMGGFPLQKRSKISDRKTNYLQCGGQILGVFEVPQTRKGWEGPEGGASHKLYTKSGQLPKIQAEKTC